MLSIKYDDAEVMASNVKREADGPGFRRAFASKTVSL